MRFTNAVARVGAKRLGAGAGLAMMLSPMRVFAADPISDHCGKSANGFLGFPTWYKYLNPVADEATRTCKLTFDISNSGDIGKIVLAIVEILLRAGGLVAVGFIIYGGIQYILTQGDPQKAVAARHVIINAVIGIVIAMLATFIVRLVGNALIT